MDTLTPKNNSLFAPIILGGALVVCTIIGSWVFYSTKSFANALSVTGSAKMSVVSDRIKMSGSFSRTATGATLNEAYNRMEEDLAVVKKFLADNGIAEDNISISPIQMSTSYDMYGNKRDQYTLSQRVTVQSENVDGITLLAKKTSAIVAKGVIYTPESLEYYYTKLPEARVSLLPDALADAKARATKIAESSGARIGKLRSASQGVVQVIQANSTDVSDYGYYDTSTKEKEIMVTVKASFTVK
jgi:hypothetical protein